MLEQAIVLVPMEVAAAVAQKAALEVLMEAMEAMVAIVLQASIQEAPDRA